MTISGYVNWQHPAFSPSNYSGPWDVVTSLRGSSSLNSQISDPYGIDSGIGGEPSVGVIQIPNIDLADIQRIVTRDLKGNGTSSNINASALTDYNSNAPRTSRPAINGYILHHPGTPIYESFATALIQSHLLYVRGGTSALDPLFVYVRAMKLAEVSEVGRILFGPSSHGAHFMIGIYGDIYLMYRPLRS